MSNPFGCLLEGGNLPQPPPAKRMRRAIEVMLDGEDGYVTSAVKKRCVSLLSTVFPPDAGSSSVHDMLANKTHRVAVAWDSSTGKVYACMVCRPVLCRAPRRFLNITLAATESQSRSRGLGSMLLNRLVDWARDTLHCSFVATCAELNERTMSFWRRHRFQAARRSDLPLIYHFKWERDALNSQFPLAQNSQPMHLDIRPSSERPEVALPKVGMSHKPATARGCRVCPTCGSCRSKVRTRVCSDCGHLFVPSCPVAAAAFVAEAIN